MTDTVAPAGRQTHPVARAQTRRMGPVRVLRHTAALTWRILTQVRHNPEPLFLLGAQPILFLVLTTFLYSQSFLTALGTGVSVWGWLTALTLAHMPAGRPTLRQAAAQAGRAALVGTPVMVALFILFPRIGPLWALPNDSGRTGLSDSLEIGSIAELAADDSVAFRVRFDGPAPPDDELYFRGPVLSDTDGRAWHARSRFDALSAHRALPAHVLGRGRPVRYEMTLEPTQLTWLPMLELTPPAGGDLPSSAVQVLDGVPVQPLADVDVQWRTRRPIGQRVRLAATAWPETASIRLNSPGSTSSVGAETNACALRPAAAMRTWRVPPPTASTMAARPASVICRTSAVIRHSRRDIGRCRRSGARRSRW